MRRLRLLRRLLLLPPLLLLFFCFGHIASVSTAALAKRMQRCAYLCSAAPRYIGAPKHLGQSRCSEAPGLGVPSAAHGEVLRLDFAAVPPLSFLHDSGEVAIPKLI